jgi:hypothetical protein
MECSKKATARFGENGTGGVTFFVFSRLRFNVYIFPDFFRVSALDEPQRIAANIAKLPG